MFIENIFLQAEQASKSLDVFQLLTKGGVVMIFLVLLSVITIFLIIERMMFLGKNLKLDEKVQSQFLENISSGKLDDAAKTCSDQGSSWGRIFIYATTAEYNSEYTDKLLEDAANVEVSLMEKNLNYLTMIAGVAPLLGFIGTIIGVITIFFDISLKGEITIPVISEGLYTKMVSSAAGLIVGIIAFSAYHLFSQQIDSFVNRIQEQALHLKVALRK